MTCVEKEKILKKLFWETCKECDQNHENFFMKDGKLKCDKEYRVLLKLKEKYPIGITKMSKIMKWLDSKTFKCVKCKEKIQADETVIIPQSELSLTHLKCEQNPQIIYDFLLKNKSEQELIKI